MGFFRESSGDTVLITAAQRSRQDELRARTRRYAITMAIRTLSFVAAVAIPMPVWAKITFVVAACVLPWLAVTAANAGPVRQKGAAAYAVPEATPVEPARLTGHTVIDVDGVVIDHA